jgi:hypothetical protein
MTDSTIVTNPSSDEPSTRSLWDALIREEQHFSRAPEAFLAAWKQGVALAAPHLFGPGPRADLEAAADKWALCPKVALIQRAIGPMSPSQRIFLAALVSFYDTQEGGRLLKRVGFHGLADFSGLDLPHRAVIAGLILNYTGW